jgi:peptide/nickel transport system permease protein
MQQYIIRRLVLMIPTVLLVSILVFTLIRLLPGDVIDLMVQENAYASNREGLEERLGLNKPAYQQYLEWIGGMLRGDFGESLWTKRSGLTELRATVPVSLELALLTIVFSVTIGVSIGILSAIRQDSALDLVLRGLSILGLSIPGFWLATLVVVLPSIWWGWSPSVQLIHFTDDPAGNLAQFAVPAAILATFTAASIMRITRTMMLEVLRQDYMRTALAKGLRERRAILRHGVKNALIPVVTVIGLQVPSILAGSVIMESIFGLPGMGRFVLQTVTQRDYPMLQMINLMLALLVMFTNLVVDLSYGFLDPRISFR